MISWRNGKKTSEVLTKKRGTNLRSGVGSVLSGRCSVCASVRFPTRMTRRDVLLQALLCNEVLLAHGTTVQQLGEGFWAGKKHHHTGILSAFTLPKLNDTKKRTCKTPEDSTEFDCRNNELWRERYIIISSELWRALLCKSIEKSRHPLLWTIMMFNNLESKAI